MNLFNSEDKLKKYESVNEIVDDYFDIRLEYYEDRKDNMIEALERDLLILSNKAKYIQAVLDGSIDLRKKKKQEIIDMLQDKDYDTIDNDGEFKYLVRMPMDSVSEENVDKLLKEHNAKQDELDLLIKIAKNSLKFINFGKVKILTGVKDFKNNDSSIEILYANIPSIEEYSRFCVKKLNEYISLYVFEH